MRFDLLHLCVTLASTAVADMELVASVVKDLAVLRRMLFACSYLPSDMPQYWEVIASFCSQDSKECLSATEVRLLMENVQVLSKQAFSPDLVLTKELLSTESKSLLQPLGVVLISSKDTCRLCGAKLLLRGDRPSRVTLYTEQLATAPATHYHKYCGNKRK